MPDFFEEELVQNSRLFYEAFLPGAVTRLRNQALARVTGVSNNADALEGFDKNQLFDVARKFLVEWKAAGGEFDAMLEEAAVKGEFRIQTPSAVFITPYPLVLACEQCGTLENHDKARRQHDNALDGVYRRLRTVSKSGKQSIRCLAPGCSGRMRQVPYVTVHRCGHLSAIATPPSARGFEHLGFKDAGGLYRLNAFFNVETGQNVANASVSACPVCASKAVGSVSAVQKGTSVTGGDSFFPQVLQFVALSERAGDLVSRVNAEVVNADSNLSGRLQDIAEGLASSLLGLTDSKEWQGEALLLLGVGHAESTDAAAISDERARLTTELATIDGLIAQGLPLEASRDLTRAKLAELSAKLGDSAGKFKAVRELLPNDALLFRLVEQRRTMEAVLLRHDVRRRSIINLPVPSSADPRVDFAVNDWAYIKSTFGIDDIAHVPDLKVVLSAVGFTREKREPERTDDVLAVKLNPFEDLTSVASRGKAMLYALSAQTEAIWVRLDPVRVLRWCVDSMGWEAPPSEALSSKAAAHAYLLKQSSSLSAGPTDAGLGVPGDGKTNAAPFHLLHTICHTLLLSARRHSGYDAQSLTEYLLPMDLSFVIYVTSVQNYTAGGLLMLFQHYLRRWFEDASMFAFNCAFDPICSDVGGACPGCVHTSRGCETFNAGISRAYLHGGYADRERSVLVKNGYWGSVSA